MTSDDIDRWFTYHAPTSDQVPVYEEIRNAGWALAHQIRGSCPNSRERDIAIDKLREAVMWANASVACKTDRPPKATQARRA